MKKILILFCLTTLVYPTATYSKEEAAPAKPLNTLVWNCGEGRDLKVQMPDVKGSTPMDGNALGFTADGKPSDEEVFYDSALDTSSHVKFAAHLVMKSATVEMVISEFKKEDPKSSELKQAPLKEIEVKPLEKISMKEGPLDILCSPVVADNKKVYADFMAKRKLASDDNGTAEDTPAPKTAVPLPQRWK